MRKILFSLIAVAALTACNNDEDFPQINTTDEIRVNASIGQMTRVATDGMASHFENGDKIMVYGWTGDKTAVPANPPIASVNTLKIENSVETWEAQPQMLWQSQTAAHYFIGIYPVRTVTNFSADAYVLDETKQEEADLLVAVSDDQGIVANNRGVDLTFKHVMAKININMNFRNQWEATPAPSEVKLYCGKEAAVNYLPQTVTADAYVFDATKYIAMPAQEFPVTGFDKSYSSIVVPQTGVNIVDIVVDGIRYRYNGNEDIPFESGKVTTLNLNVGKDEITLAGVTVGDWQDGATIGGGEAEEVISALSSPAAGTIAAAPALLDEYMKDGQLVITGKLNEADLQTLGNWAIDNSWDTDDSNNLLVLDLSGTDITAIPYLFMYNNQTKNYSAQYLQKVILPETVTTIDTHAFNCCTALNSINTGNVESMGNFVFGRCPDISNLDFSTLESIKQSAFRECVNLKRVDMPVVTDLGGRTFNEAYITELRIGAEKFSGVSSDVFDGFDRKGECTLYLAASQTVTNEGKWTPTGETDKIETVDVSGFKAVYCGDTQVWPL